MQIAYLPANHKRNIVKLQLRYTLPHAGIPQCRSISLSACFAGEVCQAMCMPTLFLMSSSSAARMMARLAVTCSLIAEIKASSPVPDISSVITPPLHGHGHRHVT